MTLDSFLYIATSYQVVQDFFQEFQEEEETAHAVSKFMNRKEKKLSLDRSTESTFENKSSCKFCEGNIFRKELCPAYGKICHKYSRKENFSSGAGHTKRLAMFKLRMFRWSSCTTSLKL